MIQTPAGLHSPPSFVHPPGLLLVGHGTRDQRGQGEFLQLADLVAARLPEVKVQASFLELADPLIPDGIEKLADSGCRQLVVVPLLLFAAGHGKRDIPEAVSRAVGRRSELRIVQAKHLGAHPTIVELAQLRYRQCHARLAELPASETLLLMVGRGSSEETATAEMHFFGNLRRRQLPGQQLRIAFMAMAEPRVETEIDHIRQMAVRRVIVQPHLLFHGQILQRLGERVATANRATVHQQWTITSHLGPAELVADLVAERFVQALVAQAV